MDEYWLTYYGEWLDYDNEYAICWELAPSDGDKMKRCRGVAKPWEIPYIICLVHFCNIMFRPLEISEFIHPHSIPKNRRGLALGLWEERIK
jgi:hypothetical protein